MFDFVEKYRVYMVYIPLTIYWIILLVLTSLPSTMAITSGVSDKIEHFLAYALLGVLVFLTLKLQKKYLTFNKNAVVCAILIASIYGILDELHQLFIKGRSCDIKDWTADFFGAAIAVLITNYVLKRYLIIKRKNKVL